MTETATPPTPQWLAARITYDIETGLLTWRERPVEDFERVQDWLRWNGRHAGKTTGCLDKGNGYLRTHIAGRNYFTHRIAWAIFYGRWPDLFIDHLNGIKSDNRLSNLREVSHIVNLQNQHGPQKHNTSGYLGVSRDGKRWRANIRLDRVKRYLGSFDTPEQAHEAYLAAKRALHEGCLI